MKTLNNSIVTPVIAASVAVDMHSHVANMPRFLMPGVDFCDVAEVEVLVSADADDYEGELVSGCSILERDQFNVYQYQYAVRNRSGNTHYGRVFTDELDGSALVFGSGWSGRASVMAGRFGVPLVECYGSGFTGLALEYKDFLGLVAQGYEGLVYIGVEIESDGEVNIDIAPYDESNMYKFDDSKTHAQYSIVLDTRYSLIFLDLAMGFIASHTDGYFLTESFEVHGLYDYEYIAHDSGTDASVLEGEEVLDDEMPF